MRESKENAAAVWHTDFVLALSERRKRLGRFIVLGLYALVAIATPLLHHDLACHFQSKSHCDACTASSTASRIESVPTIGGHSAPVSELSATEERQPATAFRSVSSGRAPPAGHFPL